MKKKSNYLVRYHLRRSANEQKRKCRKVRRKRGRTLGRYERKEVLVAAPAYLDIYAPKNHTKTVKFLKELRTKVSQGNVKICFRDTVRISAAAGLLFIAEIDRLVGAYGTSRITSTPPPVTRDKLGCEKRTVEAVLNQIGFYKLIEKNSVVDTSEPSVKCWEYESGYVTQGSAAALILDKIDKQVDGLPMKPLYRGCIEAMANCVEHAYPRNRGDGLEIDDKRWWMFAAVMGSSLIVLICDLGVGIPNTIQKTQSESFLKKLFTTFNFSATSDAEWIKAATLVKETRTQQSHRGKGGGDLRSLVRDYPSSRLSIYSNRGRYSYQSTSKGTYTPEIISDNKHSIFGTIIEWEIPLG